MPCDRYQCKRAVNESIDHTQQCKPVICFLHMLRALCHFVTVFLGNYIDINSISDMFTFVNEMVIKKL